MGRYFSSDYKRREDRTGKEKQNKGAKNKDPKTKRPEVIELIIGVSDSVGLWAHEGGREAKGTGTSQSAD